MTSGGDNSGIDLKAFVEEVQGEFRRLNARFDDLASPSKSKGKGLVGEEEDGEYGVDSINFTRVTGAVQKTDNHMGSIKMKIPAF